MAAMRASRSRGAGGLCLLILGSMLGTVLQQNFVGGQSCDSRQAMVARHGAAAPTTQAEADRQDQRELAKKAARDAVEKAAKEVPDMRGQAIGKFWVNSPGQVSFEVEFESGDKLLQLKQVIEKVLGIPVDKQELRIMNRKVVQMNVLLETIDLSDVWVIDDRDDSPERGEYNPDPEEDMSLFANPLKIGVWIASAVLLAFVVTQALELNPYANFPEGPMMDWSKLPEDERPGGKYFGRPRNELLGDVRYGEQPLNPLENMKLMAKLKPGERLAETPVKGKTAYKYTVEGERVPVE